MTRPQRGAKPTPPPAPPAEPEPVADPLAALRDPAEDARTIPGQDQEAPQDDQGETQEDEPTPVGLVTQERWDEARREAVVAFHADTTAVGFLHKGGTCGCHYIAGVVLQAVLPVQHEDDDLEPAPEDTEV